MLNSSRLVSKGALRLIGPAELIEQPSDGEIRERITAKDWNPKLGSEHFAYGQHRLGYIESRIQLDYLLSEPGIHDNFVSFALKRGVKVEVIVKPRSQRPLR